MDTLQRRIGVGGASIIGIAAMVGSGVFFVWAPAAAAAGGWMLLGLLVAASIATLNALSTAQLAMAYPRSGGVYTFAGETVNPWVGFAAGWLFLTGKIASAGASALIAGLYLWPAAAKPVAVVGVVALAVVNASGVRSTVMVSAVLTGTVVAGLAVTAGLALPAAAPLELGTASPIGVLQAAALIFFCFAGYARIATLGEEVVAPRRTIPRAVVTALAATFVIYLVVAITCLVVLGPSGLAASDAPLADIVSGPWRAVVAIFAALAALGSLLGVLAGLSRTGLAMARGGDLPSPLRRIASRTGTPIVAELSIAVVIVLVVMLLDPLALVGFSACAVLGYYAIAHVSAFRQSRDARWLPRAVQIGGAVGCLLLAVTLPWPGVVAAVALLGVALLVRTLLVRRTR